MAKQKPAENIDFILIAMEETSFGMELPHEYKSNVSYQFRVDLQSSINEVRKLIIVTNRIDIVDNEEKGSLGYLTAKYWFEIAGFETHIKKTKKQIYQVPDLLQVALNTIALSTTRGLLYASFRGTPLHQAILPVIDATHFSANEVK